MKLRGASVGGGDPKNRVCRPHNGRWLVKGGGRPPQMMTLTLSCFSYNSLTISASCKRRMWSACEPTPRWDGHVVCDAVCMSGALLCDRQMNISNSAGRWHSGATRRGERERREREERVLSKHTGTKLASAITATTTNGRQGGAGGGTRRG